MILGKLSSTPLCIYVLFSLCRTGGGSCPGKIRSRYQSLPPQLSPQPGVQQSDITAASGEVSWRKERTTDRTARSRSRMAAPHSQYTESGQWLQSAESFSEFVFYWTESRLPISSFLHSKRRREDSISKSGTAKTPQSKPRTNDSEKKRKR